MRPRTSVETVTIASGASLSGAVDLGAHRLGAVIVPSAWTAASITLQASQSLAGTYGDVYDDLGTEISLTAAAGRVITGVTLERIPLRYVKLRSGTSATPVNQAAARTLTLVLKD